MQRRAATRAWTAILWGLAACLTVQVAWGVAIDVGPVEYLDPEYASRERLLLERLAEQPDRPLVLALGSSRTIFALQAGRLSNSSALVFNFGLTGAGPQLERLALHRLAKRGVRPDLLLVEVLPPLFHAPSGPHVEAFWLKGDRLRVSELSDIVPHHARSRRLLTEWVRSRVLPGDIKRDQLIRLSNLHLSGPAIPFVEDGHGWLGHRFDEVSDTDRQRLLAAAHAQYRLTFGEFRPAAGTVSGLRELLGDARRRGIPVALLVLPEGSGFRAFYPPGQIRDFDAFLADLARDEEVTLVNARDWVSDDGFWDGHHMLARGAEEFTNRLDREALLPLLQRFPPVFR